MLGVTANFEALKKRLNTPVTPFLFQINSFILRGIVISAIKKYYAISEHDLRLISISGNFRNSKLLTISVAYKSVLITLGSSTYPLSVARRNSIRLKVFRNAPFKEIGGFGKRPAFLSGKYILRRIDKATWSGGRRTPLKLVYAPSLSQAFQNPKVLMTIQENIIKLVKVNVEGNYGI
jgi:hypothetical protein